MNFQRTALSLTLTTAIMYVLCSIAYAILPGPSFALSQAVFHGMLANGPTLTIGAFLVGLVTICVTAYITGAVFAWCYGAGAKQRA